MLAIDISVGDYRHKRQIIAVEAVRGAEHTRLKNASYYHYRVTIGAKLHVGTVLHSSNNGPIALTAKITKAILAQQKADREGAK